MSSAVVSDGLRPSFHLRTLTLGPYAHSVTLNHALFVASSSTLLSLTLNYTDTYYYPDYDALLTSLSLVTNTLQSLSIFSPIPGLGPLLSTCTSLTSLNLHLIRESELLGHDLLLTSLTRPIDWIKVVVNYADYRLVGSLRDHAGRGVAQGHCSRDDRERELSRDASGVDGPAEAPGVGARYQGWS